MSQSLEFKIPEGYVFDKDKKIIDSRTDVQKLESAGFDRKTSFRKM